MGYREYFHKPTKNKAEAAAAWAELHDTVTRRLRQHRLSTHPLPELEPLSGIRTVRRVSQTQLAIRLGIKQSEVSKLERRRDVRVSTLQGYVAALGGTLDLVARFPGLHIRLRAGSVTVLPHENRPPNP